MPRAEPLTFMTRFGFEDDPDDVDLDRKLRRLRSEISALDVESAQAATEGRPTEGAMGDAFTLGALMIAVMPTTVPAFLNFLRDWKAAEKGRSITIEILRDGRTLKAQLPADIPDDELEARIQKLNELVDHDPK